VGIGLGVLLIAFGFGRRRAGDASPASDRRQGETARGRSADTPSEIPPSGWKDIILRVYRGISENRILLVAAGVTFYALLAIFPGIAALISIYGLFADPASVASHLDTMARRAGGLDLIISFPHRPSPEFSPRPRGLPTLASESVTG
jgi:hypothetical protein